MVWLSRPRYRHRTDRNRRFNLVSSAKIDYFGQVRSRGQAIGFPDNILPRPRSANYALKATVPQDLHAINQALTLKNTHTNSMIEIVRPIPQGRVQWQLKGSLALTLSVPRQLLFITLVRMQTERSKINVLKKCTVSKSSKIEEYVTLNDNVTKNECRVQ